jgi:hypothetical protein
MGLFSRVKNIFNPSSSDEAGHNHGAADLPEEQAEAQETVGRDGLLSPRIAGPDFAVNDPSAADQLRVAADREDDGSAEMMIEQERRDAEHGE